MSNDELRERIENTLRRRFEGAQSVSVIALQLSRSLRRARADILEHGTVREISVATASSERDPLLLLTKLCGLNPDGSGPEEEMERLRVRLDEASQSASCERDTVEALKREVEHLKRRMETAPPWEVSMPPTDEEMHALRMRWAFGPDKYQADADALIAAVTEGRRERNELTRNLAAAQALLRDASAVIDVFRCFATSLSFSIDDALSDEHRAILKRWDENDGSPDEAIQTIIAERDAAVARAKAADAHVEAMRAEVELLREEHRRDTVAIRGRSTPPTSREIDAHAAAGGMWRMVANGPLRRMIGRGAPPTAYELVHGEALPALMAVYAEGDPRCWPLDADGVICAGPVLDEPAPERRGESEG